eukprot:6868559-Prymnesium_polylepis.1
MRSPGALLLKVVSSGDHAPHHIPRRREFTGITYCRTIKQTNKQKTYARRPPLVARAHVASARPRGHVRASPARLGTRQPPRARKDLYKDCFASRQ